MMRASSLSLIQFVEYDLRGAFRLMCGLFVIGIAFTAFTLPWCIMTIQASPTPRFLLVLMSKVLDDSSGVESKEGEDEEKTCSIDPVVYTHWFLLNLFVCVQMTQLPFRFRSFADIFILGLSAHSYSRENLVESFKSVMERQSWRINQYLGFLGQYIIPFTGFIVVVLFGEKFYHNPCDLSKDKNDRPSNIWVWLLVCVFVRVTMTLLWGYHTTNSHFDTFVNLRGARQSLLDKLERIKYSTDQDHHLNACSICLAEFQDGEVLVPLPCDRKHIFHEDCIVKWLKRCKACPLCMIDIDTSKGNNTKKLL